MADAIEDYYYKVGKREDTINQIKKIEPDFNKTFMTSKYLEDYLEELENKKENNEQSN